MTDSGASAGPGWYHAEGDPPGTERYWDGAAWQGEPQPVPAPEPDPPPPPPAPSFPPPPSASPAPTDGSPALTGPAPWAGSPPPKKKRSVWKWVVGLIVGFMVLIGGCTYFVWRAVSGPIDAGNEFLAAVQERDFQQAWSLSDSRCFDGAGPQAIEEVFGPLVIESYRLSSTNVDVDNGVQTGSTAGEITFGGGDTRSIELFMIERDGWLVCGFDIGSAGG